MCLLYAQYEVVLGYSLQDHKCRHLVDFEGAWQGLIQTVQWVFSSSIPPDIVTMSHPPFLSPHWRVGPHAPIVECIITYKVGDCGICPLGL